jgi:hypothetical protein
MKVPFSPIRAHFDTWTVRGEKFYAGMKDGLTLETTANTAPRLKAQVLVLREIWYRAKTRERRIAGK